MTDKNDVENAHALLAGKTKLTREQRLALTQRLLDSGDEEKLIDLVAIFLTQGADYRRADKDGVFDCIKLIVEHAATHNKVDLLVRVKVELEVLRRICPGK